MPPLKQEKPQQRGLTMKRIVSVLLLMFGIAGCVSCATSSFDIQPERFPLALFGKHGAAHACPVATQALGNIVVSAGHVLWKEIILDGQIVDIERLYLVEDSDGNIGRMLPVVNHNYSDIGIMRVSLEDVNYYPEALQISVGEDVHWWEYSYETAATAYMPSERSATIMNGLAGYIFFDESPLPGASGTCLFNENDEVLGVVSFYQIMDDETELGGAVSLSVITSIE